MHDRKKCLAETYVCLLTGFRNDKTFFKIILRLSTSLKFTQYKKLILFNLFRLIWAERYVLQKSNPIQYRPGYVYHKVTSSSMSELDLVAHFQIFRRLMKGKFDAYVLWPLTKKFQDLTVDRSTARDFTVNLTRRQPPMSSQTPGSYGPAY